MHSRGPWQCHSSSRLSFFPFWVRSHRGRLRLRLHFLRVSLLKFSRNYCNDKQFWINIVKGFFSSAGLPAMQIHGWMSHDIQHRHMHIFRFIFLVSVLRVDVFFRHSRLFCGPVLDDVVEQLTLFRIAPDFSPSFFSRFDIRIDSLQTNGAEVSDSSLEMKTQR